MTGKPPKGDKKRQLLAAKIASDVLEGKSFQAIADDMGIHRTTVSKYFSESETENLVRQAESRITGLLEAAVNRIEALIDDNADNTNALKAALAIAKTKGVIRDTVDIAHHFPPPTIIRYKGKDVMKLGTGQDEKEEKDDEDTN